MTVMTDVCGHIGISLLTLLILDNCAWEGMAGVRERHTGRL